jgi:ferredoxin
MGQYFGQKSIQLKNNVISVTFFDLSDNCGANHRCVGVSPDVFDLLPRRDTETNSYSEISEFSHPIDQDFRART